MLNCLSYSKNCADSGSCFDDQMYGNGFITWTQGGDPIWTLKEEGMRANNLTMVSQRPISNEPMVSGFNFSR